MSRVARVWSSILIAAVAGGIGLQAQREPSFRSNVDLISLMVSVTDGSGRHVTDLSAEDFEVFEDGRPQEVAFFSPTFGVKLLSCCRTARIHRVS